MEDNMFDAVRSVINFAKNDHRYSVLQGEERLAYFNGKLDEIARFCGVETDELRSEMITSLQKGSPSVKEEVVKIQERSFRR